MGALYFGPTLFPDEGWALGSHDMRGLFYPWLEHVRVNVTAGQLPWWDPTRFAGYPFLSNPQVAIFYPPTWLAILLPTNWGISLYYLLHFWLAGWGMYKLAVFWISKDEIEAVDEENGRVETELLAAFQQPLSLPGLAAGLTLMFAGFFTARLLAGHMGLIAVHAWVPWLVWATGRSLAGGRWFEGTAAGFFLGMAILAGHTTSLLYVGLIWGVFALYWLIIQPPAWVLWLRQLALAGVSGLLLAAGQLVPLAEFSRLASRTAAATYEFATDFSFPLTHLVTLLVPEFFGEPTRAGYWSVPNFEELTAYFGVVALLGVPLALTRPRRSTWFLFVLGVLGLLLALGRYGFLYRLVYDWLPPFRLARAPGRAMFVVVFSAALLMAEGLTRLPQIGWRWRWIGTGIAAGGVLAAATTGAVFAAQHPSDFSGRLWHQLGGWSLAAGLLFAAVFILAKWQGNEKPRGSRWGVALMVLIVIDLWTFGYKLRRVEPMTPAGFWYEARELLGGGFDGRILPWGVSIFDQNGAGQVGLNSLFGYNALEVAPYTALVSSVPDPRSTAYDILGATHVVATTPLDQFTTGERPLVLMGQSGQAWVYERGRALPVIRFVPKVELARTTAEAINRLHQPGFDPHTTAVVDQPLSCNSGDESAAAEVLVQRPGYWEITTRAERATLLVIAETAYPGWRVTIDDGDPLMWPVVYGALRGVCVPAGDHTVVWRFVPQSHRVGGLLSLLGLILVLASWWKSRNR